MNTGNTADMNTVCAEEGGACREWGEDALSALEPESVFRFFREICEIPHGSGNTDRISNYLVDFARERELEHYQDELGNVIIIKEASAGYEQHEPVMLQGHMDMVAVKKPGCSVDMQKEGLALMVEGDSLMAQGTSLGGDDGIALAYGLALLDGAYAHPRIELVFTVDEEVGMDGARALDVTPLKAKRLVNLDSEEEGIFLAGCAGGARVNMTLSCERRRRKGILCELHVSGLQGGHSGGEIHKERGNAICLLGRLLARVSECLDFGISHLEGGVADNAIPVYARADILVTGCVPEKDTAGQLRSGGAENALTEQECQAVLEQICERMNRELCEELSDKDSDARISLVSWESKEAEIVGEALSKRAVDLINALPRGVQAMSSAMPGLVETSLNAGMLYMRNGAGEPGTEDPGRDAAEAESNDGEETRICIGISVRSSLESSKRALISRLKSLAELAGAVTEVTGDYPGWAFRKVSPLREKMVEVYRDLYQKEPRVEAIHAGVECGLLAHKIPGLDCVSIGPDMKNIHTTGEELSISSAGRVWTYLLRLLEEL